jgi:hypothetical protein
MTSNSPDRIMENPSERMGSSIRGIAARSRHSLSSRLRASDSSLSTRSSRAARRRCRRDAWICAMEELTMEDLEGRRI